MSGEGAVVVVGGHGRLSSRYREIAEQHGCPLKHFERRIPPGSHGRICLVVVIAGMVSHALRDQIRGIAGEETPVVYLRTASISALRSIVERHVSRRPPVAGGPSTRHRPRPRNARRP